MSLSFMETKEIGDILENRILDQLSTDDRFDGWRFEMNPNKKDKVLGDILGYTISNGKMFACIDAKNSNDISINSIAAFDGFKGGRTHRAYFMTPKAIINNTDSFKNWVLDEIYKCFPSLNLQALKFEDLADYLYYGYKVGQFKESDIPQFCIMSRSKEVGINVDMIPLHFKMYYGSIDEDWYWITLRKDLKFKG